MSGGRVRVGAVVLGLAACGEPPQPDRPGGPPPGDPPAPTTWRFAPEEVLPPLGDRTQVANVRLAPLDLGPGLELLVAEVNPSALTWVGCAGPCVSEALPLPPGLVPARTAVDDLDGDGDADIVVAVIGELGPTNYLVGSVWWLRRDGDGFTAETIATDLPRTVCAESGDLDGDGDLDLTLCAFGHNAVGELAWLEQVQGRWAKHTIDPRSGVIHAFPVDLDGDGDLDLAVARAQGHEEFAIYRNDGTGQFAEEVVNVFPEVWYGTSGLEPVDLDLDGDIDVLFTNGDTMDNNLPPEVDPNTVHALRWFENDGTGRFTEHVIGQVWGAYTVRAADLDGDLDVDVVLGAFQRTRDLEAWVQPTELRVYENDGTQQFTEHEVPGAAQQLISLELGDADQDGDLDVFTTSLQVETAQDAQRLVLLRREPDR